MSTGFAAVSAIEPRRFGDLGKPWHARRRLANEPTALETMASHDPSPHDSADVNEALDRVATALDSLDLEKRAVFVLFEINNESCDEIARALEVPLGTVHSRLHAARAAFKKAHARLSKEGQP